ncbi:isoprenylcysteine carboxylmethyltransferase family protein [uncultured Clostridium sp.]|uniref:methyltransferase family protein n=1 Tax=uncultured Clostridium sp. TaxID=59620 RepID=UPI0026160D77|nr:isoprenylcysteine carboxylmethyltransferase family protein [uncultured Clostridium sp.]
MEKLLSTPMTSIIGIPINTFKEVWQFNIFNIALGGIFLLEILIFIITYSPKNRENRDKGTVYVVVVGFMGSIWINTYFLKGSFIFPKIKLPYESYIIGILLMILGIIVRAIAVGTLRKNFTLEVNISSKQKLITSGIYKYVRNPAYTGSIVSLMGIAISFRCVNSIIWSFILLIVCYSYRIKVEERALKERFGDEFLQYCIKVKKLIPFIY